ncbi:oligosaccharide flippase family protein [uncultured Dokdonia sp.]|uniref:oligosaccharide flippase family protein n=1 Tax=uncultured Dokdonia sp. TaxID=575653 RepID=UPI002608BDEE|nr:oligosaccharide flippase family protein [uncultured Dokdonia sp.]
MGIVIKQSFNNLLTTYLGFAIGALNTLYLYINFMSETYYGLVSFIVSTAMILMPFMAFGVQNTLVKFYSSYSDSEQSVFLNWMLLLPLVVAIPGTFICFFFYEQIASFLATKNAIVYEYVWYILIISISSAYFEAFFAWSKVQFKTIFGNFMKEVFHRLAITVLLVLLAFNSITIDTFLIFLVFVYVSRMLIMCLYSFSLKRPKYIRHTLRSISNPNKRPQGFTSIVKYTMLIIIAGSVASLLLDLDKFMLGLFENIENVAFYSVAIYIATVIAVPARAMHQITYPMVAQMLNEKRYDDMRKLYHKSSLTLFVIASLLFLLITCNLASLYDMVTASYRSGLYVVLFIGAAKLLDNCLGINNAILYNSDYYRIILVLGVVLVVIAIVLNTIFIPIYGINGAAIATFVASVLYTLCKIVIVYKKFEMQPFTKGSFKTLLLLIAFFCGFYFWDFSFYPFVNIVVKSVLLGIGYLLAIYFLKVSEDVTGAIDGVLRKK